MSMLWLVTLSLLLCTRHLSKAVPHYNYDTKTKPEGHNWHRLLLCLSSVCNVCVFFFLHSVCGVSPQTTAPSTQSGGCCLQLLFASCLRLAGASVGVSQRFCIFLFISVTLFKNQVNNESTKMLRDAFLERKNRSERRCTPGLILRKLKDYFCTCAAAIIAFMVKRLKVYRISKWWWNLNFYFLLNLSSRKRVCSLKKCDILLTFTVCHMLTCDKTEPRRLQS